MHKACHVKKKKKKEDRAHFLDGKSVLLVRFSVLDAAGWDWL